MIRYRLVLGIRDELLSERLQMESDIDLEKACEAERSSATTARITKSSNETLEPIVKSKTSNKTAKAQRRVLLDCKPLQRKLIHRQRRNLFQMQSKRPFWSSVLIDNSSRDYRLTARYNLDGLFRWRPVLRHNLFASSKQKWRQTVEYRSAS